MKEMGVTHLESLTLWEKITCFLLNELVGFVTHRIESVLLASILYCRV